MTRPLRIAFPVVDSRAWRGGFNYMLNLCRALVEYAEQVQVIAFFGEDAAAEDVATFSANQGIEVRQDRSFSHRGQASRLVRAMVTGLDRDAAKAFAIAQIDVVFESARFYGARLQPAAIAWFPDFQHRRLPHLFSRTSWWRREIGFRIQIRYGRTILVSNEDARYDCQNYYPVSSNCVRVLNFPAIVVEEDLRTEAETVLQQYDLPQHFVYLPNQFWQHKNHSVVIEALGILHRRNISVTLVATGSTNDPRNPMLYKELQAKLQNLGAADTFRSLGVVPRSHVIALMRTCCALLNPSLFEGWNTGVEEAKLFSTPMLLSDLNVHREQARGRARYFAPDDAEALAELLAAAANSGPPASPRPLAIDANLRTKSYAEAFFAIAKEAFKERNK